MQILAERIRRLIEESSPRELENFERFIDAAFEQAGYRPAESEPVRLALREQARAKQGRNDG